MPKVSFPRVSEVCAKDSMERSWFSSLDVKETREVDPLMSHDEEADSPLKGREAPSNAIPIYSNESRNFFGLEDIKKMLRIYSISSLIGRIARKLAIVIFVN